MKYTLRCLHSLTQSNNKPHFTISVQAHNTTELTAIHLQQSGRSPSRHFAAITHVQCYH